MEGWRLLDAGAPPVDGASDDERFTKIRARAANLAQFVAAPSLVTVALVQAVAELASFGPANDEEDGGKRPASGAWTLLVAEEWSQGPLREAARLTTLMPFWLLLATTVVKPAITVLLFGPPRPNREVRYTFFAGLRRDVGAIARFAFLALAANSFVEDLRHVKAVLSMEEWTQTQRVGAAFAIWAVSPNMSAAWSAGGLHLIYDGHVKWVNAHRHSQELSRLELQVRSKGSLFVVYLYLLWFFYVVPGALVLAPYALPAAAAYAYVTAPIGAGLAGVALALSSLVRRFFRPARARDEKDASLAELPTVGHKAELLRRLKCSKMATRPTLELISSYYEEERAAFVATGVPLSSWNRFFFQMVVVPPMLSLCVVLGARLYAGDDYAAVLAETWDDRHLRTYTAAAWRSRMAGANAAWAAL